jgi:hypothetical protein
MLTVRQKPPEVQNMITAVAGHPRIGVSEPFTSHPLTLYLLFHLQFGGHQRAKCAAWGRNPIFSMITASTCPS